MTTPIGSCAGAITVRETRSMSTRKPGAERERERQDDAVARPGQQPDGVRDDDPHEGDQAAEGDRRRRAERGRGDDEEPHARDRHAQARRLVVADGEDVEQAPVPEEDGRAERDVREQDEDVRPARGLELAEDPAVDLLHRLRAALLDVGLHGGEERGHGDAGEDERRRPAPAHRAAEEVRDADPERRAGEGGDRAQVEPAVAAEVVGDHDRRAEPGAGRRPEQVRVGERVPEDALVGGAGRGEHGADEEPERDPRRAQLPEDRVLGRRERRLDAEEGDVAEHLAGDRGDAEVDRPEREAEQRREHDEDAGGQRPARRDPAERLLRPGREDRPEPAGAPLRPPDPLERLRDQLDEDDRARAPSGTRCRRRPRRCRR